MDKSHNSVQEKEMIIIGNILKCNQEIKKLLESVKLQSVSNVDVYHYNMLNLYNDVIGLPQNNLIGLNESVTEMLKSVQPNLNLFENSRGNYFAYFSKIKSFLNGYELPVQKSLNESLDITGLNIYSFKTDLQKIINELSAIDDLNNIPADILKIKILANRPLNIYGFNIMNNLPLKRELFEKFGVSEQNIISICFDKINKQLLFVTKNLANLIVYDIKSDNLDFHNKINSNIHLESKTIEVKNHLSVLKELLDNNTLMELYINFNLMAIKFTDNLYSDVRITELTRKFEESRSVIKK